MPSDIRTKAIVLRRTNYGESDRILSLLTPEGKFSVLARSVRKEKSRLAGGIELFSVADVVIHQGRSSLGTLTGAKMLKFYPNILSDISTLELASSFLKKLDRAAEQTDNPEFFFILEQSLAGLDAKFAHELVTAWFNLNFAKATGEEINLFCDITGVALTPDTRYIWDLVERTLRPDPSGYINADSIKLARLLLERPLPPLAKIPNLSQILLTISPIVRSFEP